MTAKTLLIGLDGATFTVLDPLMDRGTMPFLRGLLARGVRAPLRTVMPPLTPPGWTSLMTGKRPGQHGVFDFFQREAPDSPYYRLTSSDDIGTPTIWSLASQAGRRVAALNFPLTFPPPNVNGCIVPGGWMPWRQLRLGCHPPGLFDRLKALPSFDARELAFDLTLEEKTVEGCGAAEYADWISLHIRREQRWLDVARYVMREEPADLIGVVFDGVDKLQHLCWRFLDLMVLPGTQLTAWERQIGDLCETYFRRLDEIIAELVELAGPGATVVLASDHGAGPVSDVFCLNTWLEQQGYLAWAGAGPQQTGDTAALGIRQFISHVYQLDWDRTVAYAATPSSQGIHIVGGPEVRRQVRDELVDALRAVRHPGTGRPVVQEIWTREEAFAGPYEEWGPDLSLILSDGGVVSVLRSDTPFKRRSEVAGSHRWEGILAASGPGIRAGVSLPELAIVDVAPLLLYSMDVDLPADLAGQLPREVFEPDLLRRRPPRIRQGEVAEQPRDLVAPGSELTVDEEAQVMQRLRVLGYVD